jgi:hypothetical protein
MKTDYSTDIDNISNEFSTVLTTFKEKFVDYYKNMNSTSVKNDFDAAKNNLNDEITKMYNLKATINTGISSVNSNNGDLEEKISSDEDKLKGLTDDYEQQTGNGSKILISDTTEKYKIQYVANITMFFGIALMVWTFSFLIKNSSSPVSSSLPRQSFRR